MSRTTLFIVQNYTVHSSELRNWFRTSEKYPKNFREPQKNPSIFCFFLSFLWSKTLINPEKHKNMSFFFSFRFKNQKITKICSVLFFLLKTQKTEKHKKKFVSFSSSSEEPRKIQKECAFVRILKISTTN